MTVRKILWVLFFILIAIHLSMAEKEKYRNKKDSKTESSVKQKKWRENDGNQATWKRESDNKYKSRNTREEKVNECGNMGEVRNRRKDEDNKNIEVSKKDFRASELEEKRPEIKEKAKRSESEDRVKKSYVKDKDPSKHRDSNQVPHEKKHQKEGKPAEAALDNLEVCEENLTVGEGVEDDSKSQTVKDHGEL